jgi:hypothetical protein
VRITEGIAPGTVLAPGVWWAKYSGDGRTINQVIGQDEADMGAGALYYDVSVRVEPAAVGAAPTASALATAERAAIAQAAVAAD